LPRHTNHRKLAGTSFSKIAQSYLVYYNGTEGNSAPHIIIRALLSFYFREITRL